MKTTLPFVFLALLTLQSCVITNTPGFYSGYKKLTPDERATIQFVPAAQLIPNGNKQVVYAVEAQSLLNTIAHHDSTLVYIWAPFCHGAACKSLQAVQQFCTKKGYNLYVVAQYYDPEQFSLQPQLSHSLLAINQLHYKADYCDKYTRLFQAELRQGQPLPDNLQAARYYLFSQRNWVRAFTTVGDEPVPAGLQSNAQSVQPPRRKQQFRISVP